MKGAYRLSILIIILLTLGAIAGGLGAASAQSGILEVQGFSVSNVEAGDETAEQEVVITAQPHEAGGSETVMIDTSELPDEVTVVDVAVNARWNVQISAASDDRTEIEVEWDEPGESDEIIVTYSLDTSELTYAEADYELEATGDRGTESFRIGSAPEEDSGKTDSAGDSSTAGSEEGSSDTEYSLDDGEGIVYVAVEDPDGNRLPSDEIDVWARTGISTHGGSVQEDGTVRLPLAAGTYHLVADADNYAYNALTDVEVSEGIWEDPYVIQVAEGATLSGSVEDSNGMQVEDARIEIEDSDGVVVLARTDADGTYSLELPPGVYSVRAWDTARVSEETHILSIGSPDDTPTLDFELRAPEVRNANVEHVDGTEPDMGAIDVQFAEQGGLVFVELGDNDVGDTAEDAFAPQDLSVYGVDETTEFEITLTVDQFDPDSLLAAADSAEWEVTSVSGETVEITVRTTAADLQLIDDIYRGPVTPAEEIDWPAGDEDVADTDAHVVQLAFLETPGLNPDEQHAVRGMSVATDAQVFGFPQLDSGELSLYLGAPGERVDGTNHEGFYRVFIPDSLLDEWDVEDPESDFEAMWKGDEESFAVDEVDDGVYVSIDPIEYSDGTLVVRATTYEEGMIDSLPSWWQVERVFAELHSEVRMQWALLGHSIGVLRYLIPISGAVLLGGVGAAIIRRRG